jgi:hypothetical protein
MAFVQRFEKFIDKGMEKGVQVADIILRIPTVIHIVSVDIKMQCRKIGAGLNNKIGITHQIGHKFVVFDSAFDTAFDADFSCFVSSNLATEYFFIIF